MHRTKLVLGVAAVCVIGLIVGSVATAGTSPPTTRPCTYGDARQTFQAPFTGNLIDSECQFRLYQDGETLSFCEGDYILGGIVEFWEYKLLGMTREEAIADLKLIENRVWIDDVETSLMRTAFKNGVRPSTGDMEVYRHTAFISQLSVGEHVVYWEQFHPDFGLGTSTVHLVVLPRADPACN